MWVHRGSGRHTWVRAGVEGDVDVEACIEGIKIVGEVHLRAPRDHCGLPILRRLGGGDDATVHKLPAAR